MLRHLQWLFNVIYHRNWWTIMCVLIWLDVFICFQDFKLVKNKQKIADLALKIPKKPILVYWYCVETFLMSLLRSYMMETNLPMCVLICLDVYLGLKKQKFVTNKKKILLLILGPKQNVSNFINFFRRIQICWLL